MREAWTWFWKWNFDECSLVLFCINITSVRLLSDQNEISLRDLPEWLLLIVEKSKKYVIMRLIIYRMKWIQCLNYSNHSFLWLMCYAKSARNSFSKFGQAKEIFDSWFMHHHSNFANVYICTSFIFEYLILPFNRRTTICRFSCQKK